MTRARDALVVAALLCCGCVVERSREARALRAEQGAPFTAADVTQTVPAGLGREQLFTVSWRKDLVEPEAFEWQPREFARPATDGEHVFVATRDGFIRAFDSEGVPLWETKTKGPFSGGIAIDGDKIFVPTGDGLLLALSTVDGSTRWSYRAGEELGSRPIIANGLVYVMSFADSLYALDEETGAWKWQYRRDVSAEFTVRGTSTPVVDIDKVFVGFSDGVAMCLDANDGAVKWQRSLSTSTQFPDVDAEPQIDGAGHVIFASFTGGIFSLDEETGANVWVNNLAGATNLLVAGESLYAGTASALVSLSASSGAEGWRLPLHEGYSGPATVIAKYLVVPTTHALLFVDRDTGRPHRAFDPGRGVSAPPAISRNALYVVSNYGYLYALALTKPGKG
jgi:outer membrane protein assembly factor BamB